MPDLAKDYEALIGKLALLATWELPKYKLMYQARYIAELVERINRLRERVVLT